MDNKIEINELKGLSNTIKNTYDAEKRKYETETDVDEKERLGNELIDIMNEIDKIESIINIYNSHGDDKEYIVLKLERLYMRLISGINSDEEFNTIEFDKKFKIFDSFFPKEWVLRNDLDKEQLLLDAIIKNEAIQVPPKKNIL